MTSIGLDYSPDVLIVGCGAAGLSLALELPQDLSVCIIAKGELEQSCTHYAQGGIAAAIGDDDSPELHSQDTLATGQNLCDSDTVTHITAAGPSTIEWLQGMGSHFDRDTDAATAGSDQALLHLGREGAHSRNRIAHYRDGTGKMIQASLYEKAKQQDNISILFNLIAIDLIIDSDNQQCLGLYALDRIVRRILVINAPITVLATGGAGKTYLYTTNPDSSSGDGIAMAWRAGCRISNMQFIQFHPTGLYHPDAKSLLISESLRGEGAKLSLPNGEPFMQRYDDRAELAPRDIVARAIDNEMKTQGIDYVYLDISHRDADWIQQSFPKAYTRCLRFGYDITKERIPVVPMVHYTCGGIQTSVDGRTDIQCLYAIGETAHTGLHGANRLASNSLLECVACARFSAQHIVDHLGQLPAKALQAPEWDESQVAEPNEEIIVSHGWDEVRHLMWDYVGIVRSKSRLLKAKQRIDILLQEADQHYREYKISSDSIEFRNLVLVASLIVNSALAREESRGLHYMKDYPQVDPQLDGVDTVLRRAQ